MKKIITQKKRRGKSGPANLLDSLPPRFTQRELIRARKRHNMRAEGAGRLLAVWRTRGYIVKDDDGGFLNLRKLDARDLDRLAARKARRDKRESLGLLRELPDIFTPADAARARLLHHMSATGADGMLRMWRERGYIAAAADGGFLNLGKIRERDREMARGRTGSPGPMTLLDLLPKTFTKQDLIRERALRGMQEKGAGRVLAVWKNRGHIKAEEDGSFLNLRKLDKREPPGSAGLAAGHIRTTGPDPPAGYIKEPAEDGARKSESGHSGTGTKEQEGIRGGTAGKRGRENLPDSWRLNGFSAKTADGGLKKTKHDMGKQKQTEKRAPEDMDAGNSGLAGSDPPTGYNKESVEEGPQNPGKRERRAGLVPESDDEDRLRLLEVMPDAFTWQDLVRVRGLLHMSEAGMAKMLSIWKRKGYIWGTARMGYWKVGREDEVAPAAGDPDPEEGKPTGERVENGNKRPPRLLDTLPDTFTLADVVRARSLRGMSAEGSPRTLRDWGRRGHIRKTVDGRFQKLKKEGKPSGEMDTGGTVATDTREPAGVAPGRIPDPRPVDIKETAEEGSPNLKKEGKRGKERGARKERNGKTRALLDSLPETFALQDVVRARALHHMYAETSKRLLEAWRKRGYITGTDEGGYLHMKKIRALIETPKEEKSGGRTMRMLDSLPDTFTWRDAVRERSRYNLNLEGTERMLSDWQNRGYITGTTDGGYLSLVRLRSLIVARNPVLFGNRDHADLLDTLPETFTLRDAIQLRTLHQLSEGGTKRMLSSWRDRGHIMASATGGYLNIKKIREQNKDLVATRPELSGKQAPADPPAPSGRRGSAQPVRLLDTLPDTFTLEDVIRARTSRRMGERGARCMVRVWRSLGYIEETADGGYQKVQANRGKKRGGRR